MQGTERITVDSNQFTRNDGNGVFLSMYNRNTTISNNDVSWNGDTVFAAWGITGKCVNEKCDKKLDWPVGPDGRNGEQPRGTQVIGNLVREIGIWQKQSSMWFQAVTAETHVKGNVHFNGPRAGLVRVCCVACPQYCCVGASAQCSTVASLRREVCTKTNRSQTTI